MDESRVCIGYNLQAEGEERSVRVCACVCRSPCGNSVILKDRGTTRTEKNLNTITTTDFSHIRHYYSEVEEDYT